MAAERFNGAMHHSRSPPMACGALLTDHAVANRQGAPPDAPRDDLRASHGVANARRVVDAAAAYSLLMAFAFAMIWIGAPAGSLLGSPEVVQGVALVARFR